MKTPKRFVSMIVTVALLGAGCASYGGSMAGVTTGGAQDVGLAKQSLKSGFIPSPEAFVIEGLLGEHDIDLAAPACKELFCMNTAAAVGTAFDTGREAVFMAVGFSSNIDLRTFRRRPLNLSVVVDRSGSMSGPKMQAARTALHKLLQQLGPQDRLSIIAFDNDVDVMLPSVALTRGSEPLHAVVDDIRVGGSTDIESALAEGFKQVRRHARRGVENRVMLLTDARPNTGRTGEGEFVELSRAAAAEGIGLTFFGIGLDFGQALTLAISRIPGANYVFLENAQKLAKVFDRDFDLLVTPVAWDFEMEVSPIPGYRVAAAYGVPSWVGSGKKDTVRIHVPTLFLSRNRGAIVLRLEPAGEGASPVALSHVAHAQLSYRAERSQAPVRGADKVQLAERPVAGVEKAVSLVNLGLGLRHAAELAQRRQWEAANDVLERLGPVVEAAGFDEERAMVGRFREIVGRHLRPEDRQTHRYPTHHRQTGGTTTIR